MSYPSLKTLVPDRMIPLLEKTYCFFKDFEDRWEIKNYPGLPIPPALLRYQVGSVDLHRFLETGKNCAKDIETTLHKHGTALSSLSPILDFGCGCGRTIIWVKKLSQSTTLYGMDVNPDAISWCQKAIDFATFSVNLSLPPTHFEEGTFGLVYAISVFTHLDEAFQMAWLGELNRIIQPDGILIASVHGPSFWEDFPKEDITTLKEKGILIKPSRTLTDMFPKYYKNTHHTQNYIQSKWSAFFTVLDYIPKGMNNHQDLVVLRKKV